MGICSIEEFAAGKDPFRAAPPGFIPTPYPFQLGPCSQKIADIHQNIRLKCYDVLRKHGITIDFLTCYSIWRKGFPSEAVDLFLVNTLDECPNSWILAASDILQLFLGAGMTTTEIKIEIRNQNKAYFDVSYCLPDDEQLLGAIRDVRENVSTFVRNQLPDVFTSIAYHMRRSTKSTSE